MQVSIFELLPDGSGSLNRAGVLEIDNLDEVGDAAEVILWDGLACQPLDCNGDGRIGFLLWACLVLSAT